MAASKYRILNQSGQGLTEYITLLMLVSVASIVAAQSLGNTIKRKIQQARTEINGISIHGDRSGGD